MQGHSGATGLGRRSFLRRAAVGLAGLAGAMPFHALGAQPAAAARLPYSPHYGPLLPVRDESTSLELLLLPQGFRYMTFGWSGDPMRDGRPTPPAHDGMAVVATCRREIVLVRNHELGGSGTPFAPASLSYDPGARGGTTNLLFETVAGRWLSSWASLSGTVTNCAGGPTPWGSWLSCEETLAERGPGNTLTASHGWVFEVPGSEAAVPSPLTALGRFVHEAVAVDPVNGYVYETEDRTPAGFYRFVPNVYGRLEAGGRLQMLMLRKHPNRDLSSGVAARTNFSVTWVDIDDPSRAHTPGTSDSHGVFAQGFARGGAAFQRLEGCWYDSGNVYFNSTSGGAAQAGQVWEYDPRREILRLLFESSGPDVLDRPDNITVSPRGGLILCEDGTANSARLLGLTRAGRIFPFAENHVVLHGEKNGFVGDFRGQEWAGACFSPDGRWLFANIQTPGITFAITGPWDDGAL